MLAGDDRQVRLDRLWPRLPEENRRRIAPLMGASSHGQWQAAKEGRAMSFEGTPIRTIVSTKSGDAIGSGWPSFTFASPALSRSSPTANRRHGSTH